MKQRQNKISKFIRWFNPLVHYRRTQRATDAVILTQVFLDKARKATEKEKLNTQQKKQRRNQLVFAQWARETNYNPLWHNAQKWELTKAQRWLFDKLQTTGLRCIKIH